MFPITSPPHVHGWRLKSFVSLLASFLEESSTEKERIMFPITSRPHVHVWSLKGFVFFPWQRQKVGQAVCQLNSSIYTVLSAEISTTRNIGRNYLLCTPCSAIRANQAETRRTSILRSEPCSINSAAMTVQQC